MLVKRRPKPLFPHFTSRDICFDTEGTGLIPYGPAKYWGYEPARPFAFAFCDGDGHTAYFRWRVNPKTREVQPEPDGMKILHRLTTEDHFSVIGHNIAYDFRMTAALGEPIQHENVHDTMVSMHVATGGDELSYALKSLSKKYIDYPDIDEKILELAVQQARHVAKSKGWMIAIGKKELEKGIIGVFAGNKPVKADYWLVPSPDTRQSPGIVDIDPEDPDVDKVQRYALGDVIRSMLLHQLCRDTLLVVDPRLQATYKREMHLYWALRRMEQTATRVYPDHTKWLIKWYQDYMLKMKILGDANGGQGVNYMSPKQMARIFYTERGYPVQMKERKKKDKVTGEKTVVLTPTCGKDQLAEWGGTDPDTGEYKDPLAKAMLEWRAAKQTIKSFLNIYSTFWYPESGIPMPKGVRARGEWSQNLPLFHDDGTPGTWADFYGRGVWCLHPNYNQCGAVTGRLTCSDPNLQQVASEDTGLRKAEVGARPREVFGPRPGCLWYLPDYSQVEVWLFAFMFQEKTMQQLLLSGHDFHQGVADKIFVFRDDYLERKKYYRKLAKLIMFGKLYGGGVGTPEKPGRMTKLLDQPFAETKLFIDSFEEQFAAVKESSEAIIKSIRREGELWNAYGRRYILGKDIAYKGVNYNIQGTAADLLKVATIRLDWMLRHRWPHPKLNLINSIHDEFIIEVPYELHSRRLMREIMWVMQMDSEMVGVPVPLPVGMKTTYPVSGPWPGKRQIWAKTKAVNLPGMIASGDSFVFGGVPRDDRPFADLRRDMQACPC